MKQILFILLIFPCCWTTFAQQDEPPQIDKPCSQSVADRNNLIDEVQREQHPSRHRNSLYDHQRRPLVVP